MKLFPTIKFVHNRRRTATRQHPAAVEMVITHQGKRLIQTTGVMLTTTQWRNGIVVGHPDADILNTRLHDLYAATNDRIKEMMESGGIYLDALRATHGSAADEVPVYDFIHTEMMRRPIKANTRRLQLRALKVLQESGLFRHWCDFTPQNMSRWTDYIRSHTGATVDSAVHNYHKRIKPYLRQALFLGYIQRDPYAGYSVPRGESKTLKYLEPWERDRIATAQLDGTAAKVRDVFIFCCYTGLAWCDVASLNPDSVVHENGHAYVQGCRQKTGTPYRNLLLDAPMKILQRYNYKLPVLSNQKMNAWLKVVAAKAGVNKNLTTHMARHTFGTWAVNHGTPIEIVSKMMGHRSIKETQIYAKITQATVDNAFASLNGK